MHPPQTRVLARRLLTWETPAEEESPAEKSSLAAIRVCNKLRRPLCALAGPVIWRLLLSRALATATAVNAALRPVKIASDGTLQVPEPWPQEPQAGDDAAREAGLILISRLLGLISASIGEAATSRLVTSEILPHPGLHAFTADLEMVLEEVDQLQGVGTRLSELAGNHPALADELQTVAHAVLGTATLLSVMVAIKSPRPN